jgi:2-polyprenyl-3-methyl-5-hydroxy-6-metoxy-1,4-benzoquinol methylase
MPTDEALRLHEVYAPRRTFDERMTNRGIRRLWLERNDAFVELLSRQLARPLSECWILDFGCGPGIITNWLHLQGASSQRIVGVDLQRDRITAARKAYPGLTFVEANGEHLPFSARQFDIVLAFTVFSSILDRELAGRIATELMRVLAIDGMIVWYDMRYPNPSNPHIRAMTRSRIHSLFPMMSTQLDTLTLLPPVAERLGPLTDALYPLLATIPAFRSHYFGLLRSSPVSQGMGCR